MSPYHPLPIKNGLADFPSWSDILSPVTNFCVFPRLEAEEFPRQRKGIHLCPKGSVECTSVAGAQPLSCWQAKLTFSIAKRSRRV